MTKPKKTSSFNDDFDNFDNDWDEFYEAHGTPRYFHSEEEEQQFLNSSLLDDEEDDDEDYDY